MKFIIVPSFILIMLLVVMSVGQYIIASNNYKIACINICGEDETVITFTACYCGGDWNQPKSYVNGKMFYEMGGDGIIIRTNEEVCEYDYYESLSLNPERITINKGKIKNGVYCEK